MTASNNIYYESFPKRTLLLALGVTASSYLLGMLIFSLVNIWLVMGYLLLCLSSVAAVIKYRCSYCYYYNKRCPIGFGKICSVFFKKGNAEDFRKSRNLIPAAILSFAVLFLPLAANIIILIVEFSLLVGILLFLYVLIAGIGGFVLRKNLYCKNCKQGMIGCPAYEQMQGKRREEPQSDSGYKAN